MASGRHRRAPAHDRQKHRAASLLLLDRIISRRIPKPNIVALPRATGRMLRLWTKQRDDVAMSELLQSAEFAGQATDVIGGTRLFSFLVHRHSLVRSIERKTTSKCRTEARKSSRRSGA